MNKPHIRLHYWKSSIHRWRATVKIQGYTWTTGTWQRIAPVYRQLRAIFADPVNGGQ